MEIRWCITENSLNSLFYYLICFLATSLHVVFKSDISSDTTFSAFSVPALELDADVKFFALSRFYLTISGVNLFIFCAAIFSTQLYGKLKTVKLGLVRH